MHASQLRVRRRVLGRLVLGRLFPGEGDHEAAAGAPRVHLTFFASAASRAFSAWTALRAASARLLGLGLGLGPGLGLGLGLAPPA